MKYLEYTPLSKINSFFSDISMGDYCIDCVLEAYSCKQAGVDKKLSRSLEQEVVESLAFSPQSLATSPVGPLSSATSRKTLVYLILTLNHLYPDYEFSSLRAHHFERIDPSNAKFKIAQFLTDTSKVWEDQIGEGLPLVESTWKAIDEVVDLMDCEIYSYNPDAGESLFSEDSTVWFFNYFFYNKKLKRILYFSCRCQRQSHDDSMSNDYDGSDRDEDFGYDMDL